MLKRQTQQQRHPFVSPPLIFTGHIEKIFSQPSPQSGGRQALTRSGRLVSRKKTTSGRCFIIAQASERQASASSTKNQTSYRHGYVRRSEFYNCRFCPSARIVKIIFNLVNPAAVLPALLVEKIHITVCAAFAFFHTAMPGIPNIMHYPFPAD